jgi:astacin
MKAYQKNWLKILVGMLAFAIFANIIFPRPITKTRDTDTAIAPDSTTNIVTDTTLASENPELNIGSQWYTSDVTSMYMGQWFTQPLTYTLNADGLPTYQGDIVLDLNSLTTAGTGINRKSLLWPNGVLIYEIDPKLPAQNRVFDAIEHWEEKTGIRFIERTKDNATKYPNYVYFQPAAGCWSYVGMIGGKQPLGLALGCSTGSTIHEIGHALGLWHEQSRIDRDEHVTVYFENIIAGMEHNFAKHITDGQDIGEYDYDSIMHYPTWAFSKNGKDTIVPKIDVKVGQRNTLSDGDIGAIKFLYGK